MAGVISAPGSKCGHWANDNLPLSPDEWLAGATPHLGSWWPVWDEWVTQLTRAAFLRVNLAVASSRLSKTRRALTCG
jgi:poly(3-hydroxyalkanoate) synthetase